jgi:hypothetical protein
LEAKPQPAILPNVTADYAFGSNPPFCNGPRFVNPFCIIHRARHSLLYGVGARPPPDGVLRGTGRPIYVSVVAMPLGGLRSDLIHRPGEGLRFGKAGVETRPKLETLLMIAPRLRQS